MAGRSLRADRRSCGAWPPSATPSSWRTTTSAPRCRTPPTSSATRWSSRARRRPPRTRSSSSAACTSWPRRPRSSRRRRPCCMPDPRAGCPMADMVTAEGLRRLKAEHPGRRRGRLRQHVGGGQGRSRRLLHELQRGRDRRSLPEGPGDHLRARQQPRRLGRAPDRPRVDPLGRLLPRARRHHGRRDPRRARDAPRGEGAWLTPSAGARCSSSPTSSPARRACCATRRRTTRRVHRRHARPACCTGCGTLYPDRQFVAASAGAFART